MTPSDLPSKTPNSNEPYDLGKSGRADDRSLGPWAVLKYATAFLVGAVWLVGNLGGYVQDVGFPICPAQVMGSTE